MLTAERARHLLSYDPETGWLTWKVQTSRRIQVGRRAGTREIRKPAGFPIRRICIDGGTYYEHRVIWLIVTGSWPRNQIDHINHDATDNRIKNLREVTHLENAQNQSMKSNNSTGVTGVYWANRDKAFVAEIVVNKKKINLGNFRSLESAAKARAEAESTYGFHENHGNPR